MSTDYCPLCYTPLETCDVAPCAECGHLPEEIDHALAGKHHYDLVRLFGKFTLVLCDFCQIDFFSHDPAFFGLTKRSDLERLAKMEFLKRIEDIHIGKDKYCPNCKNRLVFLDFVAECRKLNQERL